MTVYAIIVTYNAEPWIAKCLQSLISSSVQPHIVVIDNGSADATLDIIKQKFLRIELIESKTNLGFGQANNIGINLADENKADYVYLINQDAWFVEDALEKLIEIHLQHEQFGILSPMHITAGNDELDYNFSLYITPNRCPDFYSDLYFNKLKTVYETDFVNAAGWLISKKCLENVGLFDSLFYHYVEDLNYCHRVTYHGFKIGICPGVKMVHDRPGRKGAADAFKGHGFDVKHTIASLADIRKNDFSAKYKQLMLRLSTSFIKAAFGLKSARMKEHYDDMRLYAGLKRQIEKSRQKNQNSFH